MINQYLVMAPLDTLLCVVEQHREYCYHTTDHITHTVLTQEDHSSPFSWARMIAWGAKIVITNVSLAFHT